MRSFNIEPGYTENSSDRGLLLNRNNGIQSVNEQGGLKRESAQPAPLTANRVLKQLPGALLKKLQPQTRKVTFSGGEYIYRPDEEVDWIYFPETTAISELHILEDGRTIEVSLTGREGVVGLLSLYWPDRAANWVQVCAPGTAVKIKRDVFRKETRSIDWINDIFFNSMSSYLAQVSQKVACNAHHTVEERFAAWLLMLNDRCSAHRLKLTQEHIARVLGVYRPSVTCIAQGMRDRGLIDYVRGNIVILDRNGLMERSCSCYSDLSAMQTNQPMGIGLKWA